MHYYTQHSSHIFPKLITNSTFTYLYASVLIYKKNTTMKYARISVYISLMFFCVRKYDRMYDQGAKNQQS